MRRAPGYGLGLLCVTGSTLAWSTAGFFTRLIPLDNWTLLAWRGVFGAVAITALFIVMERRNSWRALGAMGWPGWLFAGVSAAGMMLFITSLRHTTVAHVTVIYATVPFMAAGLGWLFLRERPTPSAVGASLVALIGVGVIVGVGDDGSLYGDLLALGMTLTMAIIIVIARAAHGIPIMLAAGLSALISASIAWPLGAPLDVTVSELGLLALFGVVNSAVGLALFTIGARLLPPIETALIGALETPIAPLWVWLAFGETPGSSTIVGGVVVLAAVMAHVVASELNARAVAAQPAPPRR